MSGLPLAFVNKVLLEHSHDHLLIYYMLQWQSWVVTTKTIWPIYSKSFLTHNLGHLHVQTQISHVQHVWSNLFFLSPISQKMAVPSTKVLWPKTRELPDVLPSYSLFTTHQWIPPKYSNFSATLLRSPVLYTMDSPLFKPYVGSGNPPPNDQVFCEPKLHSTYNTSMHSSEFLSAVLIILV